MRKTCTEIHHHLIITIYFNQLYILFFSSGNRIGDYNGSVGAANAPQQLLLSANSSLLREFYQNGQNHLQLNAASSHSGMQMIKLDLLTL